MSDIKFQTYKKYLLTLPFGKKANNVIYVYLESLQSSNQKSYAFIEQFIINLDISSNYNVIKCYLSEFKVSFLEYPNFFDVPHPELKSSITVNLVTGKIKKHSYRNSTNPPILHRKETLLEPKHSLIARFEALTQAEEKEGLYNNTKIIGFKKNWKALLAEKGLSYKGHKLIKKKDNSSPICQITTQVHRHKTAIKRYKFSKPIQTIIEYALLNEEMTLLDYGCGRGDDLKGLKSMGYQTLGWDPVYLPNKPKKQVDIVNLGYVLNVIEEPQERIEVLHDAYSFSKKILVVSSMLITSSTADTGRPYKDGVLTNRNTFQKYFEQDELRQFIEDALETSAVAVAPGIFYVFRSPIDQQQFLSSRSKRYINWDELSRKLYPTRPRKFKVTEKLFEDNKDLLEDFWNRMVDLGRIPIEKEFDHYQELRKKIGTPNRAKKIFIEKYGVDTLNKAFQMRRDDLLVYLAISNFRGKVQFKYLPDWLQQDIKTFFGSYTNAIKEGRELLFDAGKPDIITKLCNGTEFGYLDKQALFIHKNLIDDLHPILRIYLGCAEILYGDLHTGDVLKLHKQSGKVTVLKYNDYENNPLPELLERVKINLRNQNFYIYDHQALPQKQLLYFKERYVSKVHPKRALWENYSRKLRQLGLDQNMGFGPSKQEFLALLNKKNLTTNLNKKRIRST